MILKSSIVGAKFHPGAHDKLLQTRPGAEVQLVREPNNPHDPNAVACIVDGMKVGYIPKAQATRLAEDLDAGRDMVAHLKHYNGVVIDVADAPGSELPNDDISDIGDLI